MTNYAFIGLGNMGLPMVQNLLKAEHTVCVFDVSTDAVNKATMHGASAASSLEAAVEGAEAVVTMLPAGEHVRSVYAQLWDAVSADVLLIDSSTVDIQTSQWCHDQAQHRGLRFVDAPVSGGISGAEQATLAFMIGGSPSDINDAKRLVEPLAGKIFSAGGPTSGTAAKIVNNLMLHINLLANSEGSQLAERLGLEPKVFHDIVSASSGRSWAQQVWYPVPGILETSASDRNFEATFRADLSAKDLGLALDAAAPFKLKMPATQLVHSQIQQLRSEALGHKDCTLIAKYVNPDGSISGYIPGG